MNFERFTFPVERRTPSSAKRGVEPGLSVVSARRADEGVRPSTRGA